jgi:Flp pilus assembly pilin Flp
MSVLERLAKDMFNDGRGATSSEYAILIALIAIVIIGILVILGGIILRLFEFEFPMPF